MRDGMLFIRSTAGCAAVRLCRNACEFFVRGRMRGHLLADASGVKVWSFTVRSPSPTSPMSERRCDTPTPTRDDKDAPLRIPVPHPHACVDSALSANEIGDAISILEGASRSEGGRPTKAIAAPAGPSAIYTTSWSMRGAYGGFNQFFYNPHGALRAGAGRLRALGAETTPRSARCHRI